MYYFVFFSTSGSPYYSVIYHHILRNTLSWGHCHIRLQASCLLLYLSPALPVSSLYFLPRSILIRLSLLPTGYHYLPMATTAIPIVIWKSCCNKMSQRKVVSYSPHLFFWCSFKVVLRQCIFFSNNYRLSEITILNPFKMLWFPFSHSQYSIKIKIWVHGVLGQETNLSETHLV